MSPLHQSCWEYCVYLYLGSVALQPEHHLLHAVVCHILNFLVGMNQSPSEVCARFQMFAMWVTFLVFHNRSLTISIAATVYEKHVGGIRIIHL